MKELFNFSKILFLRRIKECPFGLECNNMIQNYLQFILREPNKYIIFVFDILYKYVFTKTK